MKTAPTLRSWLIPLLVVGASLAGTQDPPAASQPASQPEKLPPAQEIIDQFIEATGGKKAYAGHRTRYARGRVTLGALGVSGTVETWQQSPDRFYSIARLGEALTVETGFDGRTAWEKSSLAGARILEGAERAFIVREATFNADLNWRRICRKVTTVGVEQVNGSPAYKIEAETKDGATLYLYYDQYSNLLVRVDAKAVVHGVELAVEVYPSDYREVDGVLVPHKSTQKVLGTTQEAVFEEIRFDVKIPPGKFAVPSDVKRLKSRP